MPYQIILCTCPNESTAKKIAREIVHEKLAACVNIIAHVASIYRWQEKIEEANEVLLIIKTTEKNYSDLEKKIKALHPYEIPEIIAFKIDAGLPEYLKWIENSSN